MRVRLLFCLTIVTATLLALFLTGSLLGSVVAAGQATTRFVASPPGGSDSGNNCTNASDPCATIQHAIDAAAAGDTILIAGGLYHRVGTIASISKTLTLEGGHAPDFEEFDPDLYPTVLDAGRGGPVVSIENAGDATLHHLIIRGGNGDGTCGSNAGCGGGIYAVNSNLHVGFSEIANNIANVSGSGWGMGGGIYFSGGTFIHLWNNHIVSNTAAVNTSAPGGGGGVNINGGEVWFEFNDVEDNEAASQGGGVALNSVTVATVVANLIHGNAANNAGGMLAQGVPNLYVADNLFEGNEALNYAGGGMWMTGGAGEVTRNRFVGNYGEAVRIRNVVPVTLSNNLMANNEDGAILVVGLYSAGSDVRLFNNTLVENGPFGVSLYYTVTARLVNNIVADNDAGLTTSSPLTGTVNADTNLWWNSSDSFTGIHPIIAPPGLGPGFRLLPGSPALDAGQTLAWLPVDLELQPRPQGAGYDLGAFEGAALFRLLLPAVQK